MGNWQTASVKLDQSLATLYQKCRSLSLPDLLMHRLFRAKYKERYPLIILVLCSVAARGFLITSVS